MQLDTPGADIGLTLIICTYNNAASLQQTIEHIEAQGANGLRHCSVLVIDNNCTDSTAGVVDSALARGKLFDLRRIVEARQGQAFARLRGVAEAATEWIAFVDDDNLLQEGWLAHARRFIATHPRCGAFGGRIEIAWEISPPDLLRRNAYAYAELDLGREAMQLRDQSRWRLPGAGLVCRASALAAAGWHEWQGCCGRQRGVTSSGDDSEIVMRIAREGYEIWYEPACRIRHCIRANRISTGYLERLHFSFGMANPILLGFSDHQNRAEWAANLLRSIATNGVKMIARGMQSPAQPIRLAEARLIWAYLRGTLTGIPRALTLGPRERRIWLGQGRSAGPRFMTGLGQQRQVRRLSGDER